MKPIDLIRYETQIATILRNYPSPTILDPSPLAAQTCILNLRSAIKHFHATASSRLFSPHDLEKTFAFLGHSGPVTIAKQPDGRVLASSRDAGNQVSPLGPTASTVSPLDVLTLDGHDEVLLFAVLVLKDRLLHQTPIPCHNLSPSQLTHITTHYPNVIVTALDNHHLIS